MAGHVNNADARPRIHVWGDKPAEFAFHPTATRRSAPSIGAAIELALSEKGLPPAVIIYEGINGGKRHFLMDTDPHYSKVK